MGPGGGGGADIGVALRDDGGILGRKGLRWPWQNGERRFGKETGDVTEKVRAHKDVKMKTT